MTVDGYFSGTKLISSMTEKLQCLEEKHTEFLYKENGLHEKSLIVGLQENAYHVEITRTCPFDVSPLTESKDLKLCQYKSLISEGVGVLLMRYLAITNFDGTLRFQNIAIDGEIIVSDYICTALRDIELRGHHQKVYTVERKIYKDDSLTQQVKIYLTPEGRILIHDWLDVPYVVQNNPLLQNLADAGTNGQVPMREQWMQDIQMVSKYLDAKSCNTAHYTDYLVDHPEIKQLITDYVQSLLVGNQLNHWIKFVPNLLRQLSRDESDITCGLCGVCIKCKIVSQFDKTLSD
ncbi:ciliogenesis-associated TTC17-interacting protein isoform X2 [Ooceraea biroi]|nr:ciliogenesis-associated TTC17-interacting protein isoform X2 [Ooceraea biroi]